ncbi:MAG: hypothetical protein GXP02_06615, partial [Alphaproteobacteria bacterium]|nr:hypothetical protein [Alphaproteobacteria bacterium]
MDTSGGGFTANSEEGDVDVGSITTGGGAITLKAGRLDVAGTDHDIVINGVLNTDNGVDGLGGNIEAYASGGIQFKVGKGRALTDGGDFIARGDFYGTDGSGGIDIFVGVAVPTVVTTENDATTDEAGDVVLTAAKDLGIAGEIDLDGDAGAGVNPTGRVFIGASQTGGRIDVGGDTDPNALAVESGAINNIDNASAIYIGSFNNADDTSPVDNQHTGDIQVYSLDVPGADVTIRTHGDIIDDGAPSTGIVADSIRLIGAGTDSDIGTFDDPIGVETAALGAGETVTLDISAATNSGGAHIIEIDDIDFATNNLLSSDIVLDTPDASNTLVSFQVFASGTAGFKLDANADFSSEDIDLIIAADIVDIDTLDAGKTLNIDDASPSGENDLIIMPYTAGVDIDLGNETVGDLSLTNAELDKLHADNLTIGRANSGDIRVTEDGVYNPANITNNWTLISGGTIQDDGDGTADILSLATGGTLTLDADTGIFGVEGTYGSQLNVRSTGFLAARTRQSGDIFLYEDDASGMDLNAAKGVNTTFDVTSDFTAYIDSAENVLLESDAEITNTGASSAQNGLEGVAGTDIAFRANDGIGVSGTPIVVRTGAGQLAALNDDQGGIFITEGYDGGALTLGEADVDNNAPTPNVLDDVVNAAATAAGDIEIATISGNLNVNANVTNTPFGGVSGHVYLEAGGAGNALEKADDEIISSTDADIRLTADNMTINSGGDDGEITTNDAADGGDVIFRQYTLARPISINGAGLANSTVGASLTLSESEINTVAVSGANDSDYVIIGRTDSTDGSTISITADTTLTIASNNQDLILYTGDSGTHAGTPAINDGTKGVNGGFSIINLNKFGASAVGAVDLTLDYDSTGAGSGFLAAESTSAGAIVIDVTQTDLGVNITQVEGINGISTTSGDIYVQSDSTIALVAANGDVNAGGASSNALIEAVGDDDFLIIGDTVTAGDSVMLIGADMDITAAVTATAGNIIVAGNATDTDIDVGDTAVAAAGTDLDLSDAELGLLSAASVLQIGDASTTSIEIWDVDGSNDVTFGSTTVKLYAGAGGIIDQSDADVTVANLMLVAAGAIDGSGVGGDGDGQLNISVDNLAANSTAAATAIDITEVDSVDVDTVEGDETPLANTDYYSSATLFDITSATDIDNTAGGDVTLDAQENITLTAEVLNDAASSITLRAGLGSVTGAISDTGDNGTVDAVNDDLFDISGGTIALMQAFDGIGTGSDSIDIDVAGVTQVINQDSNNIEINVLDSDNSGLTVAEVDNQNTGNIIITSTSNDATAGNTVAKTYGTAGVGIDTNDGSISISSGGQGSDPKNNDITIGGIGITAGSGGADQAGNYITITANTENSDITAGAGDIQADTYVTLRTNGPTANIDSGTGIIQSGTNGGVVEDVNIIVASSGDVTLGTGNDGNNSVEATGNIYIHDASEGATPTTTAFITGAVSVTGGLVSSDTGDVIVLASGSIDFLLTGSNDGPLNDQAIDTMDGGITVISNTGDITTVDGQIHANRAGGNLNSDILIKANAGSVTIGAGGVRNDAVG